MAFVAPPKHDPVVIKLGEDSDSDESDASDTESVKKSAPNKKKSVGGGLFGGLEMMIKEARKSAEVKNSIDKFISTLSFCSLFLWVWVGTITVIWFAHSTMLSVSQCITSSISFSQLQMGTSKIQECDLQ